MTDPHFANMGVLPSWVARVVSAASLVIAGLVEGRISGSFCWKRPQPDGVTAMDSSEPERHSLRGC